MDSLPCLLGWCLFVKMKLVIKIPLNLVLGSFSVCYFMWRKKERGVSARKPTVHINIISDNRNVIVHYFISIKLEYSIILVDIFQRWPPMCYGKLHHATYSPQYKPCFMLSRYISHTLCYKTLLANLALDFTVHTHVIANK